VVYSGTFGLQPKQIITDSFLGPAFSYASALYRSGTSIQAVTDPEMLEFALKGLRGGFCSVALKHCDTAAAGYETNSCPEARAELGCLHYDDCNS
jgi:hypothetical protein